MPNDPTQPDKVTEYSESGTTHYHYELDQDLTPEEVTEFLHRIDHDLEDATYNVNYEFVDEDGNTHWYSSDTHLMEEFDDLEMWEDDFLDDVDNDSYEYASSGGFSITVVGR